MQQDVKKPRKKMGRGGSLPPETVEIFEKHLLFLSLGALTSAATLVFQIRPFGVALLAAATSFLPTILIGGVAFSLFAKDYLSLGALALTLLLRVLFARFEWKGKNKGKREEPFSPLLFHENIGFRVLSSALSLLTVGGITLLLRNFRFFDLFGVLLSVITAPLATFLYLGAFEKDEKNPLVRDAAIGALLLTAVFALRKVAFFGIYPAAVAAAGFSFLLVATRDVRWGCVGGLLAGLSFSLPLAPAFFLTALGFGLLEKSSRGGGILAGCGAAAAYAFFTAGTAGLSHLLPSLLTAGALFLATDSAGLIEGAPARRLAFARKRAGLLSSKALAGAKEKERLREISEVLLDLSGTFYELSNRGRRPGREDLRHLCDRAFDSVCPGCRNRDICWGTDYAATAKSVAALGETLHRGVKPSPTSFPQSLSARCTELPRILSVIENGATALSEEALRGDKTSVVAMDFASVGHLIADALDATDKNFTCDTALGERIYTALLRGGYTLESAAVCGTNHRSVILRGIKLQGRHLKIRELRDILEKYCHFPLSSPQLTETEGGKDMVFAEKMSFQTVSVRRTRCKGAGKHCGDTVSTLSNGEGMEYALLCDGMGSGNHAALTSALASTYLSRLLSACSRADTALRSLNGFLAARGRKEQESSSTVDLLEVDCVRGKAALYKCGAAATYLLRRGEVTRFFSHTAPVGILESLDAECIRFTPEAGDVIVQMSDGFTGGEEDAPFLMEMLQNEWDGDAEDFASRAINRAAKQGSDDLSIIITEVKKRTEEKEEISA